MNAPKPSGPTRGPAIVMVPLGHLHPNPSNPRKDLGDLSDLVHSITEHGVLQPLLATPRKQGGLLLLAGHRRLAASRLARRADVPCIIVCHGRGRATVLVSMQGEPTGVPQAALFDEVPDA